MTDWYVSSGENVRQECVRQAAVALVAHRELGREVPAALTHAVAGEGAYCGDRFLAVCRMFNMGQAEGEALFFANLISDLVFNHGVEIDTEDGMQGAYWILASQYEKQGHTEVPVYPEVKGDEAAFLEVCGLVNDMQDEIFTLAEHLFCVTMAGRKGLGAMHEEFNPCIH